MTSSHTSRMPSLDEASLIRTSDSMFSSANVGGRLLMWRKTMLTSPRCGAKTRSGPSCRAPAVSGKGRCRMHGGAKGSGAPKENQNAFKHGTFTKAAFQERAELRELIREVRELQRTLGPTD